MAKKTSEEHQANSRLGALGESFVQTFLLEHCDWCYKTQEKHPADLIVELGSAKYTIQVKSRRETKQGKYVLQLKIQGHYLVYISIIIVIYTLLCFLIVQENISSSNQITLRRLTTHLNHL